MIRNLLTVICFFSSLPIFGQWYDYNYERNYRFIESPIYIPYNKYNIIYQNNSRWTMMYADSASFRVVYKNSTPFGISKDGIYIEDKFIKADTTDFELLTYPASYREKQKSILWKNNKHVYRNDTILSEFDAPTFSLIYYRDDYVKDKNGIYYQYKKMTDVDEASFRYVYTYNGGYYRDTVCLYEKGKQLLIDDENVYPVNDYLIKTDTKVYTYDKKLCPNIDAGTLRPLSRGFSMDKRNIYYANQIVAPVPSNGSKVRCYDWYNCRYVVIGNRLFSSDYDMTADYRKRKVDIASFGMYPYSDNVEFDKYGAFYRKWNESKGDIDLIRYPFKYDYPFKVEDIRITSGNILIYKDREFYDLSAGFMYGEMLENLTEKEKDNLRNGIRSRDLDSIIVISPYFLKSKGKILYNVWDRPEIGGIDVDTFEPINGIFAKDKNGVYTFEYKDNNELLAIPIEGVDKATFVELIDSYAKDKYNVYNGKDIVKDLCPEDIKLMAVFIGYRMGCSQDTNRPYNNYMFSNKDGYWIVTPQETLFLGQNFPNDILYKDRFLFPIEPISLPDIK